VCVNLYYPKEDKMNLADKLYSQALIFTALSMGYKITVEDEEEEVIVKSSDKKAIFESLDGTGQDFLYLYKKDQGYWTGWIRMIYNNGSCLVEPSIVVCDHSVGLSDFIEKVNVNAARLIERLLSFENSEAAFDSLQKEAV
jgi:hypothetical protein